MTAETNRQSASRVATAIVGLLICICIAVAIGTTLFDKRGEALHLSLRSDVLRVQTAGALQLHVRAGEITLDGVTSLSVPGLPEPFTNNKGESYVLLPDPRAPRGSVERAGISFDFTGSQKVEFLRRSERPGPVHEIRRRRANSSGDTPGTLSEIVITMQPGQQLLRGDTVIYKATEKGGGNLTITGGEVLRATLSFVQPDSSTLVPTRVSGLEFDRDQTTESRRTPSGILGGDLSFLTLIDRPTTLRQGADLRLKGLDGELESLTLGDDAIVANVVGTVDEASLAFGGKPRTVQPTWFDSLLNSRAARATIGTLAFLMGLLSNLRSLLGGKEKAPGPTKPSRSPEPTASAGDAT